MQEIPYRAARLLRALGSAPRYQIVQALAKRRHTPSQLAKALSRELYTVSAHLAILRQVEVVRFESSAGQIWYQLKDPAVARLLADAERCVRQMNV